jgi:hypothetical protein
VAAGGGTRSFSPARSESVSIPDPPPAAPAAGGAVAADAQDENVDGGGDGVFYGRRAQRGAPGGAAGGGLGAGARGAPMRSQSEGVPAAASPPGRHGGHAAAGPARGRPGRASSAHGKLGAASGDPPPRRSPGRGSPARATSQLRSLSIGGVANFGAPPRLSVAAVRSLAPARAGPRSASQEAFGPYFGGGARHGRPAERAEGGDTGDRAGALDRARREAELARRREEMVAAPAWPRRALCAADKGAWLRRRNAAPEGRGVRAGARALLVALNPPGPGQHRKGSQGAAPAPPRPRAPASPRPRSPLLALLAPSRRARRPLARRPSARRCTCG